MTRRPLPPPVPLDRLPVEEPIYRNDAATEAITGKAVAALGADLKKQGIASLGTPCNFHRRNSESDSCPSGAPACPFFRFPAVWHLPNGALAVWINSRPSLATLRNRPPSNPE